MSNTFPAVTAAMNAKWRRASRERRPKNRRNATTTDNGVADPIDMDVYLALGLVRDLPLGSLEEIVALGIINAYNEGRQDSRLVRFEKARELVVAKYMPYDYDPPAEEAIDIGVRRAEQALLHRK